jgi:hypothetical protein
MVFLFLLFYVMVSGWCRAVVATWVGMVSLVEKCVMSGNFL